MDAGTYASGWLVLLAQLPSKPPKWRRARRGMGLSHYLAPEPEER
jgi:hypothetical protein